MLLALWSSNFAYEIPQFVELATWGLIQYLFVSTVLIWMHFYQIMYESI